MKILGDKIWDERINSWNVMIEISLKDYFTLSENILKNNDLQRGRVKSSNTVYSLLKTDLKTGCIIPPIVLALRADTEILDLPAYILEQKDKLIILDGLQRSYTIRDLVLELERQNDPEKDKILENKIRAEIYLGINKLGILYRMLTLNSGQTPMSTRHQIEIIYSDYIGENIGNNISLIRAVDQKSPSKSGEYNFRDIIEGFTSFIDRDYLTLDRSDILDNIRSLEKLSSIDQKNDLFSEFIIILNTLIKTIDEKIAKTTWSLDVDNLELEASPFGRNVITIFNKSQAMTGLGSAIGKLIDFGDFEQLSDFSNIIHEIKDEGIDEGIDQILISLDKVRFAASKIGNDQRMYFHFLFRELFSPKGDAYLNLLEASKEAYRQYQRKTM